MQNPTNSNIPHINVRQLIINHKSLSKYLFLDRHRRHEEAEGGQDP